MCDEEALEEYMENGEVETALITSLIAERKMFPVCFGSGLKTEGVEELLELLTDYTKEQTYPEEFSARVYKIGHDTSGTRLT